MGKSLIVLSRYIFDEVLRGELKAIKFLKSYSQSTKADSTHNQIPLTIILASKPVSSIKAS